MSMPKTIYSPYASGVAGLAEASIKGQWEFGMRRGALMIMSRPCRSYIPPKVFLKQLVDIPALKDKSLITEVVSCPAYGLYLSSASESCQKQYIFLHAC